MNTLNNWSSHIFRRSIVQQIIMYLSSLKIQVKNMYMF